LSKILEGFVGYLMLEEISGKFDDHQYGALKSRSTTHELVNICHEAADNHQSTRTVIIDFAKAFDDVDQSVVLNKMVTPTWCSPFNYHPMDALSFI
jgi:hypothetical protein